MVDALRRAHRWLRPAGLLIDVHPTASNAAVEVGDAVVGHVDAEDGPARHAAAGEALDAALLEGLFTLERALEFDFFTYGDTADELRDYIADNWCLARIDDATVARARREMRSAPGAKLRVCEHVRGARFRRAQPSGNSVIW
jgi:hypothetical protein